MIVVPSKMGRINTRTLVGQLQKLGTSSRADLARVLGISQPTAGRIVDDLLEAGVLEEFQESATNAATGKSNGKLGRPGRSLRLDSTRPRFLAIHLGVSETCLAALPLAIRSEDLWNVKFPTPPTADDWLAELKTASAAFSEQHLGGVLLSVPGIVDERIGKILCSPNIPWTADADLHQLVRSVWDLPVLLVQEERALALGHHVSVPSDENFLLVDFGEGVGGAVVVGGRVYSSPLAISGELGHTPVRGNWRPCGCGAVGCVETLVSTHGLLQSYGMAAPKEPQTWTGFVRHIAEHGVTGWLAEGLEASAVVIAGALNVLGLGRVVITGSLLELGAEVSDYLSRTVNRGTMWARFGKVECVTAPRRRTAGLVAVGIDRLVIPMSRNQLLI